MHGYLVVKTSSLFNHALKLHSLLLTLFCVMLTYRIYSAVKYWSLNYTGWAANLVKLCLKRYCAKCFFCAKRTPPKKIFSRKTMESSNCKILEFSFYSLQTEFFVTMWNGGNIRRVKMFIILWHLTPSCGLIFEASMWEKDECCNQEEIPNTMNHSLQINESYIDAYVFPHFNLQIG